MKIWFCVCVHVQELLFFLYEYLLYELINYLFPQYNFFFLKVKPVHLIGDIYGEGNGNPLQYSCRKMPWMEEPGELQSMGLWRVGHDWATSLSCIGEGNGNPLQCSCLENPRDGEAWWAAVSGVAQSWTRLKWLGGSSSSKLPRDAAGLEITLGELLI